MERLYRYALVSALALLITQPLFAANRIGRLGIGTSSQLKNNLPTMSFKLQKSQSFALGFLGNYSSATSGGYGLALKAYRNLFDEPQLNFYMSGMAAYINKSSSSGDTSGFQVDIGMGSEFSFSGVQSIGFSFEVGISLYELGEFTVETLGNSILVAGIHFYL